MNPRLTFVTTCMGRLHHLQQSLPRLVAQPSSRCVVVDYSCPESAGDWVEQNFPNVHVVRVQGEKYFQPSRAKNCGAQQVDTEWLCLIDADILLDSSFYGMIESTLQPGEFFRGPVGGEGTFGTMICQTEAFHRVGGLDERYQGWGDEDADLYDALRFHGLKQSFLSANLLQHLDHGHDDRVRFASASCREESLTVNRIYRQSKWDLARLHEQTLSAPQCEKLYRIVQEKVQRVWQEGRAELVLDTQNIEPHMGSWRLDRRLTYRIAR